MKVYALRTEDPQSVLGCLVTPQVSLKTVQDAYYAFLDKLVIALSQCSSEPVKIELHDFADLEKTKISKLEPNKKYLNFDSQSNLGISFGVSRQFDFVSGKQLGITSRPGFNELSQQISAIATSEGNSFSIIEDDIFSGGTIRLMVEMLKKAGISVDLIISGISSTKDVEGIPVLASAYYDPGVLLELTDPRDYILGSKNGGLVVSHLGRKFRVPYCPTFVDVQARSSIDPKRTNEFATRIIDANLELHKNLGSLDYPVEPFYPELVLKHVGLNGSQTFKTLLTSLKKR